MGVPCSKCGGVDRYSNGNCKQCLKARQKAKYLADPEKQRAKNRLYYAANRERHREYKRSRRAEIRVKAAIWRGKNEERVRAWNRESLLSQYGLTSMEYSGMLAGQGEVCAICKRPETVRQRGKVQALAVDHNHTTGKVRALLCNNCNVLVGYSKESPETLRAAAVYLEYHINSQSERDFSGFQGKIS